ncbi:MAG: ABC transporter ATP-binding protein/permease [Bacilli bacterium]|nr:ABC transporter ATP-binding protein/permease [Bacilli bacterium]
MWKNFKLILHSLREYKIYAILTPLLMVAEAACDCALPFIMSLFVNEIQTNGKDLDLNNIGIYAAIFLSIAIISLICGIMGAKTSARASVGLAQNLRGDIFKKIESFSFANIDRFSTSSLVTRLTTDVNNTFMTFNLGIRIIVRAPLMFIFATVLSFVLGGQMAWIFVGVVPLVCLGFFFMLRQAGRIFTRVFKRYDKLNESIQENIAGIRVVKNFVREEHETKKMAKASNDICQEFKKAEIIVSFASPIMNLSIHIVNILVCSLGGWLVYESEGKTLNVGQLSALLTYGVQILMALLMVTIILGMLSMSLESIRRIAEVLQEESTIKNPNDPIMLLQDGSVIFNKVTFKYSKQAERNTLDEINLSIKPGQFIGIIGSTGSGKTTLVSLISRLYDISTGELIVGGHPVHKYDLRTLRDNVAVVLQKNVLFSGTIADNLRWGDLNATNEEILAAAKIAQADEFVQNFPKKYETYIEQGGTNVSGGQRQRLCIARALLKKPKILILDDSTSAVDTKTDALIRQALKNDLPQTTKIVIAQRTSSVEDADQIIVMDNGHIDQIGTHDELLRTNKIYQEVYHSQNRVNQNIGGVSHATPDAR